MLKNKVGYTVFALLIALCSLAAEYEYSGVLTNVKDEDFYRIQLSTDQIALLKQDFSDIKIIDSNNAPVPYILSNNLEEPLLHVNATFEASHTKEKSTYLFSFDKEYFFNGLEINFEDNSFFHRNAAIKYLSTEDSLTYSRLNFELNSSKENTFEFELVKTSKLYLEVENKDNPPIYFEEFKLYCPNISLIAKLEPNIQYQLLLKNPEAQEANYDLVHFKDQIPSDIREIKVNALTKIEVKEVEVKVKDERQWIVWAIIGVIVLATSLITFKVLRELR